MLGSSEDSMVDVVELAEESMAGDGAFMLWLGL